MEEWNVLNNSVNDLSKGIQQVIQSNKAIDDYLNEVKERHLTTKLMRRESDLKFKRKLRDRDYKRKYDKVIKEINNLIDYSRFQSIDTSDFDYSNYEDVILYLCYSYYQEWGSGVLPDSIDMMKKYIINMNDFVQRTKERKSHCWTN